MTGSESTPAPTKRRRPREQFTGQTAFILAAVGSAIGLGNIWRFPGVAYENGGGAFMVPYLIALLTAGIPILFLDYAIGHRFRGAPPQAFRRISRGLESLGWFQIGICIVIALYYTAVIAWAVSYFFFSFNFAWGDDPTAFFVSEYLQVGDAGFSLDFVPGVLIPLVAVWIVTIVILGAGVAKGIERANVIFIPLLVVTFTILVVRALFLDGAADGLNALFTPDWSTLTDANVWIAAYGQIFFSLSIAFGIMITYSSFRPRRANITGSGLVVAFANSSFEILAGIGVFATLGFLAFNEGVPIDQLENLTGVGLSFMTFPAVISEMPGGQLFGALFFGTLVLAGLTSLLSILQVVSSGFQDKFGWSPRASAVGIGSISAVISVGLLGSTTGLIYLDTTDNWANNIGIVGSAILMTVLLMWVLRRGKELQYHLNTVSTFKLGAWWRFCIAVLAPVVLTYMLISRIVTLIQDGYEGYPTWYLMTVGWGSIGFMILLAVVMPLIGRKDSAMEGFVAWPTYPPHDQLASTTTEARR